MNQVGIAMMLASEGADAATSFPVAGAIMLSLLGVAFVAFVAGMMTGQRMRPISKQGPPEGTIPRPRN